MKIYADVMIIENTIVDLFLLILTMNFVKHKTQFKKLIFSAFIGGVYTVVMFIPKLKLFTTLPFELLIAFIMIKIVYYNTTIFNMIKLEIIFLLLTCMLSGLCFWFSTKENIYILGSSFVIQKNSLKYIILSAMIIYIICNRIVEYIKERSFISSFNYLLKFHINDTEFNVNSFLDTGNELREPITNLPCILIEQNLIDCINFNDNNSYSIPYNAVGYNGSLKGIKVKNIKITGRDGFSREVDAIVCPCNEKFSKENEFNALLSRGIV